MDEKEPKNPLRKWAVFTGIAFEMGAIIAVGVILGQWLDGKYPNEYATFTIIFSLLGVFIALYTVIKQVKNLNE